MHKGDKAKYGLPMRGLTFGSIGILDSINNDFAVIVYPQNAHYEDLGEGKWKEVKGAPYELYCHSAKINEITIIHE